MLCVAEKQIMFEYSAIRSLLSKLPVIAIVAFVVSAIILTVCLPKLQSWRYSRENTRLKAEVQVSKAAAIAARKDESQVVRSADITAKADASIDKRVNQINTETAKSVEAVNESIRNKPVPDIAVPDPGLVRNAAAAYARAQSASDRLQSQDSR